MAKLINTSNIPLSMACWLANSTYDFTPKEKALSATDFNKSIRQIILRNRNANADYCEKELVDISSLVKSKCGTAIHDAIEQTWKDPIKRVAALRNLGYPEHIVRRIRVNPSKEELAEDHTIIPVYMEIRNSIEIDGYTISGKFDFAAEGKLTDFKTTGVWKWGKLEKADKDYCRQGSIYRLIHKDILDKDFLEIVFLFTDWSAEKAKGDRTYPQGPCVPHKVKLWSEAETTKFIKGFIADLEKYKDTPEPELPECSADQLWQDPPTYKYYKNPANRTRATKNFDNFFEAQKRFIDDGAVGIVVTVPSEAKACKYCPAFNACTQKDKLIEQGVLKIT